jgi:hypothetical protein
MKGKDPERKANVTTAGEMMQLAPRQRTIDKFPGCSARRTDENHVFFTGRKKMTAFRADQGNNTEIEGTTCGKGVIHD